MERLPVIAIFIMSFPEVFVFTWLAFVFLNIKVDLKRLALLCLVHSIIVYFLRWWISIFFLYHLLYSIFLFILIFKTLKLNFYISFLVVIFTDIFSVLIEYLELFMLDLIFGNNLGNYILNFWFRELFLAIKILMGFILMYVIIKYDLRLFNNAKGES